jgi:cystathionine gamma-lyase
MPPAVEESPFLPGPTFASVYHLSGNPDPGAYAYGRDKNPTWTRLERALEELEGGPVVAFASGMAAVAAVFGTTLRPGDVLVMASDGYYKARTLANEYLAETGVIVRQAPIGRDHGAGLIGLLDDAKLLWLETPTNPRLDVCDITSLSQAAHERGALVAVDNTTATCLGQVPLQLGADFSVASDTKALTGHSDVVMGHVATSQAVGAERLGSWRSQFGAIPGPMEVWLAHRSLSTLELRLGRQSANALAIANFLSLRSELVDVRYPGLATDSAHEIARLQMRYFGPVLSFTMTSIKQADVLLSRSRLITQATSFGGIHTTAERRGRWPEETAPEGLVRLSAGCEDVADLLEDIEEALTVAFQA